MGNELDIVGREIELSRLHELARLTGIRSILFITGPSGIGKTTLVKALDYKEDINLVYVSFLEPPKSLREAAEEIKNELDKSRYAELRKISEKIFKEIIKAGVQKTLGVEIKNIGLIGSEARKKIYDILDNIAQEAEKIDKITVIVIDEAQNLLRGLQKPTEDWSHVVWSFIKALSSIQEEWNKIRVIVVTSDYFFHEDVFMYAPSLDYIDTFYLGEMTKEDAVKLYSKIKGQSQSNGLLELIGGKPAHIREVARYPRPKERLCSIVRRTYNAIVQRMASLPDEIGKDEIFYRGPRGKIRSFLSEIASNPVSIARYYEVLSDVGDDGRRIMRWLIDNDILQFSCRYYTGIYNWNLECDSGECGGGGLCGGLDTVAASSRPALAAIVAFLASVGGRPRAPLWAIDLARSCIGVSL